MNIHEIIYPINELEKSIISDPEFIEGALWGKPRNGHPEGQVINHIKNILDNIISYHPYYNELRLIAIIHDTFKYKVDITKPKNGENHHAYIARKFAEKYIDNKMILDVIELHDEGYNAFRSNKRDTRFNKLIERITSDIDTLMLYLTFYRLDNSSGDKKNDDVFWFEEKALPYMLNLFLRDYAVLNPNYDDDLDSNRFTSPDADEFFASYQRIYDGEQPIKVHSTWESGGYQPYNSSKGRYIHDCIKQINNLYADVERY